MPKSVTGQLRCQSAHLANERPGFLAEILPPAQRRTEQEDAAGAGRLYCRTAVCNTTNPTGAPSLPQPPPPPPPFPSLPPLVPSLQAAIIVAAVVSADAELAAAADLAVAVISAFAALSAVAATDLAADFGPGPEAMGSLRPSASCAARLGPARKR